jgi:hypothetical protein
MPSNQIGLTRVYGKLARFQIFDFFSNTHLGFQITHKKEKNLEVALNLIFPPQKKGASQLMLGGSHFFHGTTKVGLTRV